MTWIAVGVGTAASVGGSIFSGIMGAKGAAQQASSYKYGVDQTVQYAREAETRMRQDLNPFMQAGQTAANQLGLLAGGQAGLSQQVMSQDPMYQWQSEEGQRLLDRQLAQRGLTNSGAGLELNRRFLAQLLGEESTRYMTGLQNTAALGANAAARSATNTTSLAQSTGQAQMQGAQGIGSANLSQGIAYGNIGTGIGNTLQGGANTYLNYQLFSNLMGGGGGGGGGAGMQWSSTPLTQNGITQGPGGNLVNAPGAFSTTGQ